MTAPRARVGVTREGDGAQRLARALADHGLVPVVVPLIARVKAADGGVALRAALATAARGDWVVVTSPNGADAVLDVVGPDGLAEGVRVAAVGPSTAERLAAGGWPADLVPDRFDAASLAEALVTTAAPARAVVAVSALADDTVEDVLVGRGWQVERVEAYRILPRSPGAAELDELAACDLVTLASGSAAGALAAVTTRRPVVCMGEVTAARAADLGLDVRGVADPSNLEGLVAATMLALDRADERHEETNEQ